ncbi:MAG: NeuD/PglB/VioB family sugar acetyltransferase [Anaerolineales bacterium]|nr:NeuD/PglB/VioB family sugar acetyltransferase [Anaerolineales bacterium]
MKAVSPVLAPLLNPNEPEAVLAALFVSEGQWIDKGEPLCSLETTKSTAELQAEAGGFVIGLRAEQGQTVRAGELLCYLSQDSAWQPPSLEMAPPQALPSDPATIPGDLRITQPALALARQAGLDLSQLPRERLVTESVVRALLEEASDQATPESEFDASAIIVYGGGGHGKALIDLLRALHVYRIVGVVDDGLAAGETIMSLPVLGGGEMLPQLHAQGVRLAVNAVGGIGNLGVRLEVFSKLAQAGFACPAVVHPSAFVEPSASLSPGVQVMPLAYVGSQARLGFGCIVNSGAIVSHDCQLGDCANVSPGAMLAGEVRLGAGVLVGMGATLNLRLQVGARARIGNGATVKSDVPENGIVRAGTIWPE